MFSGGDGVMEWACRIMPVPKIRLQASCRLILCQNKAIMAFELDGNVIHSVHFIFRIVVHFNIATVAHGISISRYILRRFQHWVSELESSFSFFYSSLLTTQKWPPLWLSQKLQSYPFTPSLSLRRHSSQLAR